jgi:beta-phosphoglucomutase-like phosphatase (HAD superfamily)
MVLPCPALDAEPGECALVGDSVTDIQGARLVSVQSIGYANEPANANTSPQPEQAPLSTASRT